MATSFVPYQIDFSVKNTSKTFGFSKKRVSFKFGIASPEAVAQGATGAGCRGSEHEVIFIWSLNSGKRQILCDGKDVHYSESGQNGWTTDQIFHHSFHLRAPSLPGTPLKCHLITQPKDGASGNVRPFDLRLQGASFFLFNKIFQLGTPQMVERPVDYRGQSRGGRTRGGYGGGQNQSYPGADEDPSMTYEERQAIEAAKLASLKDYQQSQQPRLTNGSIAESSARRSSANEGQLPVITDGKQHPPPPSREEESLISFDFDPAPLPASQPHRQQPNTNFMSSVTLDPAINGSFGGGPPLGGSGNPWDAPPQQQQQPPPQQGYNNYALPPSYSQPPALPATNNNAFGSSGSYSQQQQQPSANDPYGQRSSFSQPPPQQQQGGYGGPPPAAGGSVFGGPAPASEPSNALTPYQAPAGQQQPYYQGLPPQQTNGHAQQQPQGNPFGAPAPTPAPVSASYGYGQPPAQQQQQNPFDSYGGGAPAQNVSSPSNQTLNSYGSAPSFAQPPQQQQQQPQYGGYPPQQQQQYSQYGQQPPQQQQGGFPF